MDKKVGAGIGVLIIKDGKVLLGKRNDDAEKASSELRGEGTWTMPGGKIHFGETIFQAAKRELFEETGMQLISGTIICVNNEKNNYAHFVTVGILCEKFEGLPETKEPEEITQWEWFSLEDIPENLYEPSKSILECWKNKEIAFKR